MAVRSHRQNAPSRWLRIILPVVVIVTWFGVAGVGGPYFGRIDEVSSNDLATFLPENAESTKVKEKVESFVDASTIPALIVFESDKKLTATQKDDLKNVQKQLNKNDNVVDTVASPIISEDKKAAFLIAPLDSDSEFQTAIPSLQKTVNDASPDVAYTFTGPAMFSRDLNQAFAGIDGTLLVVALSVVFVILLVVYRSPLLPIITLLGAMIALTAAIFLVWNLANAGLVQLNGQVQGILFILVIGAATDYSLLYIARYREELTHHQSVWRASVASWKASFEPIVAAGGTVSLGLLCLLASDLGSNKALGPVGSIGVIFSIIIALTFLPAVLLLLGRASFWPRRPQYVANKKLTDYHVNHSVWSRIGAIVGKYPRRIWMTTFALLLAATFAIPQLKAEGVSQENLILGASEARDGQAMLSRHFPAGAGVETYITAPPQTIAELTKHIDTDANVESVSIAIDDKKYSSKPLGKFAQKIRDEAYQSVTDKRNDKLQALRQSIKKQSPGAPDFVVDQAYNSIAKKVPTVKEILDDIIRKDKPPKIIDDEILLEVTLKTSASSIEARQTVQRLRKIADTTASTAMVGGVSAIQLDTNTASDRDIVVVIPLILLAITVVLMLLLRAVVAPIVLLLTTIVSFGATLGIAALLFNYVWKFPGADPTVVIFGFVFLVALGIDYNIFLMTRVREETMKLGVRGGTIKALVVTGGVITSAGIVLAATFAALYVIPILFLAQIAFIVAFGVLLDTLIVRSLLVPTLTLEVGKKMWWPSKLAKKGKR